jgi:Uma2 family endonuclease
MGEPARSLALLTVDEFVANRSGIETKAELVRGVVHAMTGGTDRHNKIAVNGVLSLGPIARERGCELFVADMALQVSADTAYYPDVMVVCDAAGDTNLTRTKPCLVIEVLSPSTRSIDEREKRVAYLRIPSMHDYLVVHPEDRMVDHHHREHDDVWSWTVRNPGDTCPSTCLGPFPIADLFISI